MMYRLPPVLPPGPAALVWSMVSVNDICTEQPNHEVQAASFTRVFRLIKRPYNTANDEFGEVF